MSLLFLLLLRRSPSSPAAPGATPRLLLLLHGRDGGILSSPSPSPSAVAAHRPGLLLARCAFLSSAAGQSGSPPPPPGKPGQRPGEEGPDKSAGDRKKSDQEGGKKSSSSSGPPLPPSDETPRRVFSLRKMAAERKSLPPFKPVEEKLLSATMHRKGTTMDAAGAREAAAGEGGNYAFYDRNFITVMRAMQDFLLTAEDLRDLRVTSRRSPNERDPPIKVYWRKDVESRSREVWGSLEALEEEKERRMRKKERSNLDSIMTRLIRRRKERERETEQKMRQDVAAYARQRPRHTSQVPWINTRGGGVLSFSFFLDK